MAYSIAAMYSMRKIGLPNKRIRYGATVARYYAAWEKSINVSVMLFTYRLFYSMLFYVI